jgi:hypothetical protein
MSDTGVVALAALQMASGASDEEWVGVMGILAQKPVPATPEQVVADVRSALAQVRESK